jgi:hypothetical protein
MSFHKPFSVSLITFRKPFAQCDVRIYVKTLIAAVADARLTQKTDVFTRIIFVFTILFEPSLRKQLMM